MRVIAVIMAMMVAACAHKPVHHHRVKKAATEKPGLLGKKDFLRHNEELGIDWDKPIEFGE
jgi:hypothetical protein